MSESLRAWIVCIVTEAWSTATPWLRLCLLSRQSIWFHLAHYLSGAAHEFLSTDLAHLLAHLGLLALPSYHPKTSLTCCVLRFTIP